MNIGMMKMVGVVPYVSRRILWRIRRGLGWRPVVRLANGLQWKLPLHDLFASDVFVTQGNVDLGCEHILLAYLKDCGKEGVAMDVGAHSGYYSLLFSTVVSKVFAFEPDSRNFPVMDEVAEAHPRIVVQREAVGDFDGQVAFSAAEVSDVSHIEPGMADGSGDLSRVPILRLDTFVGEKIEGSCREGGC
jgi:FkbM family methyltransferase